MRNGMRYSCDKIHGIGKPRSSDWSIQPQGKKTRGGWKNDQLLISHTFANGQMLVRINNIRTNNVDGRVYGLFQGKKVVRNGYAYSLTRNGSTPGRWFFV